MEGILVLIAIVVGWFIISRILSAGARTVSAVARTAAGKGTFSENVKLQFEGMGPLKIRFNDTRMGEDKDGLLAKGIEARGLFPVARPVKVAFVTSVLDKSNGEFEPVISAIDVFQEPDSIAYQHVTEVGPVSPDQGFPQWVRLGVVIPDVLQPPFGGRRTLTAILRMIDLGNSPRITNGFSEQSPPGLLWQQSLDFEHEFNEKGYQEAAEHRDEARALAIKVAMAVAMADGSLDETEGIVLKEWISKAISSFTGDRQETLKAVYNNAMREAHTAAKAGELSLSTLTQRLNEIAEKSTRYEAIELCFDVMAADGVADSGELATIRKVAEALELDFGEIEKLRDQRIIGLDASVSDHASVEDMLGIEADWDESRIKKHLRVEFQKWNNRLNTLQEGTERDNAQRMLDMIAKARAKYG